MAKEYNIRSDQYRAFIPLFVGREHCAPGHAYGPAVRGYWLVHYVLSGKGYYRVGDKEYTLSAGQAFIIRPDEVTFYRSDDKHPWHYVWAAFQSELPLRLPHIVNDSALTAVFAPLQGEGEPSPAAVAAIVWQVIDRLCPPPAATDPKGYVATAKSIVHKRYMQQDLSVEVLAGRLGLDRSYFSGLFKQETGESPGHYLLHYRMQRAKELLLDGHTVTVVAASVGYKDPFTFSRSYKSFYGAPPSELKKGKPPQINSKILSE